MKKIFLIFCLLNILPAFSRVIFADDNSNKLYDYYSCILAESILNIPDGEVILSDLLTVYEFNDNFYFQVVCKYDSKNNCFTATNIKDKPNLKYIISNPQEKEIIATLNLLISKLQLADKLPILYFIYHDEVTAKQPLREWTYTFSTLPFQKKWKSEKEFNKKLDPINFIYKWIANIKNTPMKIYNINNLPTKNNLQEWEDSVRKLPRENIRFNF